MQQAPSAGNVDDGGFTSDWLENWREYFSNQSESKENPSRVFRTHFPALDVTYMHFLSLSSDWSTVLFTSAVIGK